MKRLLTLLLLTTTLFAAENDIKFVQESATGGFVERTLPADESFFVAEIPSVATDAEVAAGYEPLGVTAADITDSTADGRALITSADANPFTDASVSTLASALQSVTLGQVRTSDSLQITNTGGGNVSLSPATSTLAGILTAGNQTFGGTKTFQTILAEDFLTAGVRIAPTRIQFEGSTNDLNDLFLEVENPTAARTITLPDLSGNVILDAGAQNITGAKTFSGTANFTDFVNLPNQKVTIGDGSLAAGSTYFTMETLDGLSSFFAPSGDGTVILFPSGGVKTLASLQGAETFSGEKTFSTSPVLSGTVGGTAPATPTSAGTAGEIVQSGNYLYICIAPNTWRRAELLTW